MASPGEPRSNSAIAAQAALEIAEEQQGHGSMRSSRTVSAAGIEPMLPSVAEDRPSNRLPPIKALGSAGRQASAFADMADEPFRLSAGSGLSLSAREAAEGPAKDALASVAMSKWRSAGRKVSMTLQFSASMKTLRDRYGVNEIDPSEIKTVKKLGEGGFAVVEQCLYTPKSGEPPSMVAVKKLKPEILKSEADLKLFLDEVSLMRKLKHDHIVAYIGIGKEGNLDEAGKGNMFLVSELMGGGTMKKMVMKQMTEPHKDIYTHHDALRWLLQISTALMYCHESNPKVIHRDLKLENILLSSPAAETKGAAKREGQDAKLADFGLFAFATASGEERKKRLESEDEKAKLAKARSSMPFKDTSVGKQQDEWERNSYALMRNVTHREIDFMVKPGHKNSAPQASLPEMSQQPAALLLSGKTGTLMYMAPEMYRCEQYDEKVDVFSFAIIMYELLHKYMMIFAVSNKGNEAEIEAYASRVASGYRPPVADKFPQAVKSLLADAWHPDPKQRPTMRDVMARLKAIKDTNALHVLDPPQGGCCIVS